MSLKRVLGPVQAGWLVAGNMVGAGIFFMPGLVSGHLPGFAWPLLAWTAGGLLALGGAAVYAELGSRIPRAGGDYQYLATAFGPLWAFLTGWAGLLLTFSGAAAAMAHVVVNYMHASVPATSIVPIWIAAPAIILVLTATNALGARAAGSATAWMTAVPIAGLIVMFVYGLIAGTAEIHVPETDVAPAPFGLGVAMVLVFFTYSGWNAAAYLAAEIRDPQRNLARGLLWGTALVTLLYLLMNTIFLVVVPQDELAGSTTAGSQAARAMLGDGADRVLSLIIAIAVLGSINVTLMAGARIYYAMARDGLAPPALGRVNAAGVPAVSLWASGAWAAVLATTGRVETLVNWATLAILLLSSLAVAGLFVLRRRDVGGAGFRCPGYPLTPVVYLVACLGVALSAAAREPLESLYGALLVATGVPAFFLMKRWFRPL